MRRTLLGLCCISGIVSAASASAQSCGFLPGYGYGGDGYPSCYSQQVNWYVPQVYFVGGYTRGSHRESNVPFPYASFFYGESFAQWRRHHRQ